MYRIENKYSGRGETVNGSFHDAVQEAMEQCTTDYSRWVVYRLPDNTRVAEVSIRGMEWHKRP